jgi:hypothetical protein
MLVPRRIKAAFWEEAVENERILLLFDDNAEACNSGPISSHFSVPNM